MRFATAIFCLLLVRATPQKTLPNVQQRFGVAIEAIFGVGIRLQVLLDDPSTESQRNFLVSPLSATLLLSQLMLGADQDFRIELHNLLSLPNNTDHNQAMIKYYGHHGNKTFKLPYAKLHSQMGNLIRELNKRDHTKSFVLNCSSGLFYNSQFKLLDNFKHNLHIYETALQPLNFSTDPTTSRRVINDWAAEQTRGVIKSILPATLPRTTAAIFSNAIYFKADWETPFSYELNTIAPFHTGPQQTVNVEYMQGIFDNLLYVESSELRCRIVRLPYKNDEVAMYFILPTPDDGKEYNIRKFTADLNPKDVIQLLAQMKKSKVALQVPKFKIVNNLSVLDPLQRYRVFERLYRNVLKTKAQGGDPVDIIQNRIDLYNALRTTEKVDIALNEAAEQPVKISNIFQQVSLSVDEKGTEAAAISASVIDYIGGTKSFRLERPFSFLIEHEPTSVALFWGTLADPTQIMQL
ncbi:hypothetical protein PPYR_12109 [Photinus pyralis]|uniref:Serpin domain-containing protein n=1 Tax=Photinus pyralis TaxID=7054 RepID=A0A1Y1MQZ9_PHOPY|nr:leukocyte elastase inhibitor-like [Photinus pyralis]KAB0795270.1 hypothetical protein PPYR_12109 [Photinus pyralis]